MVKNDPMQFNHWVYGKCNNDSDTKGIAYLINHNLYEEALCIRKYYDLKTDSYYETSDEKFRWPSADKGCSHHEGTFYGIILEKCKNNTARKRAGFGVCRNPKEIDDFITNSSIILQLIDFYADVLNYNVPFTKYFYALTNGLFKDSFTVNHLNFNPGQIKTHNGIFFDNIVKERAHFYVQNEKVTMDPKDTGMVVSWYFWMSNTMEYYERNYRRMQDILGDIGGISSIIVLAANIINFFVSYYIIIFDTKELMTNILNLDKYEFKRNPIIFKRNEYENENQKEIPISPRRNLTPKNNIIEGKLFSRNNQSRINSSNQNLNPNKNNNRFNFTINNESNNFKNLFFKRRKNPSLNEYFTSSTKNYIYNKTLDNNNIGKTKMKKEVTEVIGDNKIDIENFNCIKQKNISFFKFICYYFTCCKKYSFIGYYKKFRNKIISEENITQNYFDIYKVFELLSN